MSVSKSSHGEIVWSAEETDGQVAPESGSACLLVQVLKVNLSLPVLITLQLRALTTWLRCAGRRSTWQEIGKKQFFGISPVIWSGWVSNVSVSHPSLRKLKENSSRLLCAMINYQGKPERISKLTISLVGQFLSVLTLASPSSCPLRVVVLRLRPSGPALPRSIVIELISSPTARVVEEPD